MSSEEKIEVTCPKCPENDNKRTIKAVCWKPKKDGIGPPYIKVCRKHSQEGKIISQEQKDKTSKKLKGQPKSPEMKQKLSLYRKEHPELWITLEYGKGAGWNEGLETGPMSEETKQKISESMKGKNMKGNKNES